MVEPGAEWLVEEGIGEDRAIRLDGARIAATRIAWHDRPIAGSIIPAVLVSRAAGSDRGTARSDGGHEILVDRLPRPLCEGARFSVEITRAPLDGPGRYKRAQGRASERAPHTMTLADVLRARGERVSIARRFPADWDEVVDEALAGEVAFPGGNLLLSPTPALTAIDVDGTLAPKGLALAAVPALAAALHRFAIGGAVVIDFPTLAAREDRRAVDTALNAALARWPHERTAMNGFGLVQLVARMEAPSLLQLAAWRRADLVWHRLLRRAERLEGAGMVELSFNPAIASAVRDAHIAALQRRCGKPVTLRPDPALDPDAPHAQLVADAR